jgi:hypothetical protein
VTDSIFSRDFLRTTAELAIRGAASGFLTAMGGPLVDAWHLNWTTIGGLALSGSLVSVAFSLSSFKAGSQKGTPLVTSMAPHGWNPVDPLGDD